MQERGGIPNSGQRAYRAFWAPLRARLKEDDPSVLEGRSEPKSFSLITNGPLDGTFLRAEIRPGALCVELEITTGDTERNRSILAQLRERRPVLEGRTGELDFRQLPERCKIVKLRPWVGDPLTQPRRHAEACLWFYASIATLRRALENVAI
jgi:hypothetical protein